MSTILIAEPNGLATVMLVLMAVMCALIAFKRNNQNSDVLMICLGIGDPGFLATRLLSIIVNLVVYPGRFGNYLDSVVLALVGMFVAVGSIFAIDRFLLGENPIVGKGVYKLKFCSMYSYQYGI